MVIKPLHQEEDVVPDEDGADMRLDLLRALLVAWQPAERQPHVLAHVPKAHIRYPIHLRRRGHGASDEARLGPPLLLAAGQNHRQQAKPCNSSPFHSSSPKAAFGRNRTKTLIHTDSH